MLNSNVAFAAAGLFAAANGHMLLSSPQGHTFLTDQNTDGVGRPLNNDGSDFPCRNPNLGSEWTGPVNSYALGSSQQLALVGTAVHGGGTCQMSITYDTEPTAKSVFKVIHTIQGGCPARNTAGNLDGDDPTLADPFTYDYTIPDNIPTGNATIAWSWMNRIGNREFYMECGVLELTGTSGDQANFDALPDLFVANVVPYADGCLTDGLDSSDPVIPNPGDSVEYNTQNPQATFGATCGSLTATGGSGSTPTSYAASGGSAATSAVATSVATSEAAATTSAQGGVFITKTQAATSVAETTTAVASVATSSAAAATSASSGSSGSSDGSVKSGACDTEGMFSCAGDSYQQCASGTWSVSMPLAAGTSCTVGESTDMQIAAAGRKMVVRALKN
ncbi:hypothetical protein BJ166DRAFT_596868 [Pestalotiopsis sp. NC0098]|nr:hypothetical protein BJ166DRAFT_596868 [Pestalotiopsis sp. NC0098]